MAPLKNFVPFFAFAKKECFGSILTVAAQGHGNSGNHGGGGSVPGTGEVDAAIVNIGLHYNDKLCLELLLVDCSHHVTAGDENVCGSDGVTYENHCKFTHAICEYAHSNHQLHVASHGACSLATAPPATAAPGSTMVQPATTAPPATAAPGSTMMPPASTVPPATQMATGTVAAGSTNAPMTTASTMAPTEDPIHAIVQGVFCKNAASISCADDFNIICGSDGQLYPNQCEMSKQKCNDPSLTVADKSTCPIPGR